MTVGDVMRIAAANITGNVGPETARVNECMVLVTFALPSWVAGCVGGVGCGQTRGDGKQFGRSAVSLAGGCAVSLLGRWAG